MTGAGTSPAYDPAPSGSPKTLPRILFYTHGLVDGGAERLWACLATAFRQRGYDVQFAQDFDADENRANLDPAIPVHTLGRNHFAAIRNLAIVLATEKPDIALSATGGSNLKLMMATLFARSRTANVLTYHGELEWKLGWISYFSYLALPFLSRWAARTVAVSDGLYEKMVSRWKAHPSRLLTLHNPVFVPAAARAATLDADAMQQRENVVLAVGRLVPEKDFLTLIRAFARLRHKDSRLLILGKGPEQPRIEAEIRRLRLQDRVELAGYVKEPWTIYAAAKCFVSSSSSEPFGNVIVEAMAYGLPVVATACSGPQEILQYGIHGRIVGIGNHVQLAQAIDATLRDPGDPGARRRRAEEFSFAARVPAYEELIHDVLTEARAGDEPPAAISCLADAVCVEEGAR